MCEDCVKKGFMTKEEAAVMKAPAVSEERLREIREDMKRDSIPLDFRGILRSLSEERWKQEDQLHREVFGAGLMEIWTAVERMGEGVPPTPEESRALAKWLAVNLRSKAAAFGKAQEAQAQIGMLLQVMRMAGLVQSEGPEEQKKETVH